MINIKSEVHCHQSVKFLKILALDGIRPTEIAASLNINDNIHNIFQSGQGAGKSGSFFFFSNDNKYLIKTMKVSERRVLFSMLDDLHDHFQKT